LKSYREFHISNVIKLIDEHVILRVRINFCFEYFLLKQI